jgi:hypothetical protein
MAFREKRSDTLVRNIESTYGIDLRTRGDKQLGALLDERGYESQSQLLKAHKGVLDYHPTKRIAFLSFHWDDYAKVRGLRLMFMNRALELDIEEISRKAVRSENETYVRSALKRRIEDADVLLCVLGNGTGSRDWVEWEIETAINCRVPLCGVRIPGTFGRIPNLLRTYDAPIANWDAQSITTSVESAIAQGPI